MTATELGAVLKGIVPVIREYIDASMTALKAEAEHRLEIKLAALESGRDGLPGIQGEKGLDGRDGEHGRVGPVGEQGVPGERGERGDKGEPGNIGERGPDGLQGIAGRDGLPGVQGPKGLDGLDGRDGTHGKDGTDGLRPDDFDFDFDAKTRSFTVRFVRDGVLLKEVSKKFTGVQIYRGVYVSSTTYEEGDTVTYGGSQWCAKEDTSTEPNEHAPDGKRAWQLCIQRGRTGKQGLSGANGLDGKDGRPGRDLTQLGPDGSKW